jgi:hypothetical protein
MVKMEEQLRNLPDIAAGGDCRQRLVTGRKLGRVLLVQFYSHLLDNRRIKRVRYLFTPNLVSKKTQIPSKKVRRYASVLDPNPQGSGVFLPDL